MGSAAEIIAKLQLEPHPEGGWFRETWRAPAGDSERASATAIHFLLEADQNSHWHVVDAAEIWLWHAGDPLELRLATSDAGPVETITLGPDVLAGHCVQHVIPPDEWQAAHPIAGGTHGYTLVSCIVSPGFEFAGFTLAKAGWNPGNEESPT
ncbi:MAG: cupin domain-containing protein [Sphingomonadaceae bacterium]|nr:cupin domain-containing protein [Sphingomonadaceae bacterium]